MKLTIPDEPESLSVEEQLVQGAGESAIEAIFLEMCFRRH